MHLYFPKTILTISTNSSIIHFHLGFQTPDYRESVDHNELVGKHCECYE